MKQDVITKKKYEHLKSFFSTLNELELKQLKEYEEKESLHRKNNPISERTIVQIPKIKHIPADYLYNSFLVFLTFYIKNIKKQKIDIVITDRSKKIIYTLCQYFGKNEDCPLNLNKGILLSGDCGVGKTAMMYMFHKIGEQYMKKQNDNFMWFRYTNTIDVVSEYLTASKNKEESIEHFFKKYMNTSWLFDDFGEENLVYGSTNVMQEVISKKYRNENSGVFHYTTNLTMEELKEKYGTRIEERFFEMNNYIEFHGDSLRRL